MKLLMRHSVAAVPRPRSGSLDERQVTDLVTYRRRRTGIQVNASPARPADVDLVASRLLEALLASRLFAEVEVEATDDPDQLVIALCRIAPGEAVSDVATAVENVWSGWVRYPFWEAHGLETRAHVVELGGVSRSGPVGRYVTVHVVAHVAHVPAQRTPSD